jgi:hypothetical protein
MAIVAFNSCKQKEEVKSIKEGKKESQPPMISLSRSWENYFLKEKEIV